MSPEVWDEGKREVLPASRNSGLGLLRVLKIVVRDEFWKRMVNKFAHSLLEEYIARVRI